MADWPTDQEQGIELHGREADRGAEGVLALRSPPGPLALRPCQPCAATVLLPQLCSEMSALRGGRVS